MLVTEDKRIPDLGACFLQRVAEVTVDADTGTEGAAGFVPSGQAAVRVGDAVQCPGDRPGICCLLEDRQPGGESADRRCETALVAVGVAEVAHGGRPLAPVGAAVEDPGRLAQQGDGLVVAAQFPVQGAEAPQDPCLGVRVRLVARGVEGELMGAFPGPPVGPPVEHGRQRLGQPPGPVPQTGGMHVLDQRDEVGPLRGEPAPWIAAHHVTGQQLLPRLIGDARCARVDESGGQLRCADVLIGEPGQGIPLHIRGLCGVQAFPGEVAQQVMQPVPDQAGGIHTGDVDEHRIGELFQQPLGFVCPGSDERREVPRGKVRGEQAQHAERELLGLVPAVVAQRE